MPFNYNKLWKLLIDKSINKVALRDAVGITSSTLARLSKNENVSLDVLVESMLGYTNDVHYIEFSANR